MSELIAEARVLVTPDTTAFRTLLTTELAAITRTIPPVPIAITPVVTGTGSAAAASAARNLADAETTSANAIRGATDAKTSAIKTNAAYTRSLGGVISGAASAGLSLVGLRGATLAATGPFLAGAAGLIALGKSVALATSFNSEIAVLGATTGATGIQLEQAAEAAREFGRDITLPGVTAGDAAKTITEFSKAGLSLNDSIKATRGGLQLAQAAQLSYTDAVTLTANALNAFNLSGDQAVRVADTLANAANLAQGGIGDTALALRQAAGAAAVVGVSFEDTAALLTLLAKNGLTGSDAGTALRTAFLRLVNPSEKAKEILERLNVNLRDISGAVRPEVFAEFAAAQADLSVATQQANAAIVFGQDAFRAFGFLAQEGTEGLTEVQIALRKTGTAAEIARARMVGLAGAQENLSNQLSTLGETIGQIATPPLTFFVDELARYVGLTGRIIRESDEVAEGFAKLVDELPGGKGDSPIDFGFGDAFRAGAAGVRDLNPQVSAIFDFVEIIEQREEEARETIKNGGVELRDALETAGREAARGAVSFKDQITNAINAAFDAIADAIAAKQRQARSQQLRAVAAGQGQAAGLDEIFDQIIAGGGTPQEQIAGLRRKAAVQARIIRDAGPDAQGVLLEARREAQSKLASINSQITSLEEGIAADQEAAQKEQDRIRKDAATERDRVFLQAQEDARTRQERLVTLAEDTPAFTDDIRRQEGLRALIQKQILALRQSAVAEKTKEAALRALRAARDTTTDAIRDLREADRQQRADARQESLDAQIALAEAEGNTRLRLQLINVQIRGINAQIASGKVLGAALNRLKADRETLEQQREDIRDAEQDAQVALAQSIFDLTGNKNPLVRAIDARIAETRADIKRIQAAGRSTVELRTALNKFLLDRKNLLKEAEEDQGTTAFELLTQAVGRFGVAGNLIGAAQPFAGPTEFTADLSQFLRRQTVTTTTAKPSASPFAGFQGSADRLVEAINRNTAALNGGEEGPTKRKGTRPPVSGAIDRNDKRWRDADRARAAIEGAG